MKIVVGSTNPVKVGAVTEAFQKYWPNCEVKGTKVESGIGEQPRSEEETRQGARNRANACLGDSDFGVGIEGGVCDFEGMLYECAWVCIIRKDETEGLGGGLYFELPKKVAEKIRAGGELGPVMDLMSGQDNVKQKMGAIGMFTKGQLDRKSAYVQIVLSAIIKFVSPEWYD